MCNNAMTYNRPETIYYKEAKRLLQSGIKLLSKVSDIVYLIYTSCFNILCMTGALIALWFTRLPADLVVHVEFLFTVKKIQLHISSYCHPSISLRGKEHKNANHPNIKVNGYTFRGSNSDIFFFFSPE